MRPGKGPNLLGGGGMSLWRREAGSDDPAAARLRRYGLVLLGGLVSIVAAAAIVIFLTWSAKPGTTEYELNKILLQALLVAFGGGVLSFLISGYQERQARVETEHTRRRNKAAHERETLGSVLERATTSYNGVKRARRLLRAQAVRRGSRRGRAVVLVEGYDAQMAAINDLQLEFETLSRTVHTQKVLDSSAETLHDLFHEMESYLGELITEYEELRPLFGRAGAMSMQSFKELPDFLERNGFNDFATRFHEVQQKLRDGLDATLD